MAPPICIFLRKQENRVKRNFFKKSNCKSLLPLLSRSNRSFCLAG